MTEAVMAERVRAQKGGVINVYAHSEAKILDFDDGFRYGLI